MRYRSFAFLVAVFGLCSVDLFLCSGRSSRPSAVLGLYGLVFNESPATHAGAIAQSDSTPGSIDNAPKYNLITIAYHVTPVVKSGHATGFANMSK